jgi:hypothetical protein
MEGRSEGGVERDPAQVTPELLKVTRCYTCPDFDFDKVSPPLNSACSCSCTLPSTHTPLLLIAMARKRKNRTHLKGVSRDAVNEQDVSLLPFPNLSPPCCLRFPNLTFNLTPPPRLALPSPLSSE